MRLTVHETQPKPGDQSGAVPADRIVITCRDALAQRRATALSDELTLNGIVFVLRTGTLWEQLPQELGFGSGMACWRRLRDWQVAGVWHRLHLKLLTKLRSADKLDFSRACMDGANVPSPRGLHTGPNSTDRGKLGSKRYIVTDAQSIPLIFCVTGANRHDSVVFEELIDALPQ